jgi:20S proteasome alpha/beta subunit
MTTIVTTASKNFTVMAADQGITGDLMHPEMKKIIKQGTWLIGVSGEDRICDVIQYAVKYPKVPATLVEAELDEWLPWIVTRVVPAIQQEIQDNLHKDLWNTVGDSEILLVTHAKAFLLSGTLGVTIAEPYWAIGSGAQLAMGSLGEKNNRPDWRVQHGTFAREAIEVAERHDPFTRGKVTGYRSYPSGKITAL